MTAGTGEATEQSDRFRHEAVLYRGDQGFVDLAVPFVRDGLAGGEAVLLVVSPARRDLLCDALGADAGRVRLVDLAVAGRNPARIIPIWRELVEDNPGRPVRGIGEQVRADQRPPELTEALLHEALLNLAFADGPPLHLRCPFDLDTLKPTVIQAAYHQHPVVIQQVGRAGDHRPDYRADDAAARFAEPLPPADPAAEVVVFRQLSAVRALRTMVERCAVAHRIGDDRAADLALAVHEIAMNSLRHGGDHGELRIWSDDDALVCEISDAGRIDQPLVGRVRPLPSQLSGRGVWLANQLCDLVQIRSSATGTVVRLHTYLRG